LIGISLIKALEYYSAAMKRKIEARDDRSKERRVSNCFWKSQKSVVFFKISAIIILNIKLDEKRGSIYVH